MTWGVSTATPFATNKSGAVRYLLIIENEAYTRPEYRWNNPDYQEYLIWYPINVINMVKWRATLVSDPTKYIQCSDCWSGTKNYGSIKGKWSDGGYQVKLVTEGTGVVASTFLKAFYVNGASVSVDGTLTAVGPLSTARGANNSQRLSDYTTCIVFSADVYVEVIEMNTTVRAYAGVPNNTNYYTRESNTLAAPSRLGMFAAYPVAAYVSDVAFVASAKATSNAYAIPWLIDTATLATALLRHHGCVADMSRTLASYSYSPTFTGG